MGSIHAILLVFVLCYNLLFHDKVQCNWNLSKEENLVLERRIKLLKKPATTTIVNKYGDIYDCVDFYKQLAFDHALLKNQTLDYQIQSISLHNKTSEKEILEVISCPVGSVPIRRITKDDLIREMHSLEGRPKNFANRPHTYLAIARTQIGKGNYIAAECRLSMYNPKVFGQEFSTARIKLQNGPDSIEAGWRVDPTLYGDNKTRFFIRTDAGMSHCFNTRCPGFVHRNKDFPLDSVMTPISIPGGQIMGVRIRILRDSQSQNWNLRIGDQLNIHIGFWPSRMFTGLKDFANYIEWGGAVYSPPGFPLPQMGSGIHPTGDSSYDAYIKTLKVTNQRHETTDADYELYTDDSSLYSLFALRSVFPDWGVVLMYGGPDHR